MTTAWYTHSIFTSNLITGDWYSRVIYAIKRQTVWSTCFQNWIVFPFMQMIYVTQIPPPRSQPCVRNGHDEWQGYLYKYGYHPLLLKLKISACVFTKRANLLLILCSHFLVDETVHNNESHNKRLVHIRVHYHGENVVSQNNPTCRYLLLYLFHKTELGFVW